MDQAAIIGLVLIWVAINVRGHVRAGKSMNRALADLRYARRKEQNGPLLLMAVSRVRVRIGYFVVFTVGIILAVPALVSPIAVAFYQIELSDTARFLLRWMLPVGLIINKLILSWALDVADQATLRLESELERYGVPRIPRERGV